MDSNGTSPFSRGHGSQGAARKAEDANINPPVDTEELHRPDTAVSLDTHCRYQTTKHQAQALPLPAVLLLLAYPKDQKQRPTFEPGARSVGGEEARHRAQPGRPCLSNPSATSSCGCLGCLGHPTVPSRVQDTHLQLWLCSSAQPPSPGSTRGGLPHMLEMVLHQITLPTPKRTQHC